MNKLISTKERVFMCVCCASGSGKTRLTLDKLSVPIETVGVFQPPFDNIIYFYRFWQPVYNEFLRRIQANVIFKQCEDAGPKNDDYDSGTPGKAGNASVDSYLKDLLSDKNNGNQPKNDSQSTLLIFDESCDEILQSKLFATLATAGRHKGFHIVFIKHNLYQQGRFSVTVDKNTSHVVILKSPRIGKQLKILGSELDVGDAKFLEKVYRRATSAAYGHLLIDMTPSCDDLLRFCTNITGSSEILQTLTRQFRRNSVAPYQIQPSNKTGRAAAATAGSTTSISRPNGTGQSQPTIFFVRPTLYKSQINKGVVDDSGNHALLLSKGNRSNQLYHQISLHLANQK